MTKQLHVYTIEASHCTSLMHVLTLQVNDHKIEQGQIWGWVQGVHPPPPTPWDEAFFFVFAFKICLLPRSVTSFLGGAPPSKKSPGSAPAHMGSIEIDQIVNWKIYSLIKLRIPLGKFGRMFGYTDCVYSIALDKEDPKILFYVRQHIL